jgi:hypothetical protein
VALGNYWKPRLLALDCPSNTNGEECFIFVRRLAKTSMTLPGVQEHDLFCLQNFRTTTQLLFAPLRYLDFSFLEDTATRQKAEGRWFIRVLEN